MTHSNMTRRDIIAGATMALGVGVGGPTTGSTGLYVPPEERRHDGTFMQWPVNRQVHPDPVFLDMLQQTIADIANAIAEFEPVTVFAAQQHHAAARLRLASDVTLWDIPTEDLWCRDAGPIFMINGTGDRAISHIQFNGWGKKQVHTNDAQIAAKVAERLGLPLIPTGLKGEAGGVEQDGHGLLMAHESSWVNDNRNPGLTKDQVSTRLLDAYGANRIIWSKGLKGEDITDYHIDSLVRFTGPARALINLPSSPDPYNPFHTAALDTYDALADAGVTLDVIPEPNQRRVKSQDFVASYANYYVCNGAIIAAQFGDTETDQIAYDALKRHYPNREVIMLNVDPVGEVGGGIHCATQQVPTA